MTEKQRFLKAAESVGTTASAATLDLMKLMLRVPDLVARLDQAPSASVESAIKMLDALGAAIESWAATVGKVDRVVTQLLGTSNQN